MGGVGGRYEKRIVTRTTQTQIIIGEERFRKENGNLVGGSRWSHASIGVLNPDTERRIAEHEQEQAELRLAWRLSGFRFVTGGKPTLPNDTMVQILALIEAAQATVSTGLPTRSGE